MFEIDEQKFKLLKMMESLLKTGNAKAEEVDKYKDIATKIDSESFNKIKDMIDNIANHSHKLDEELKLLEEVSEAYDQLELIQCRFKNSCELYPSCNLQLNNLNTLKIEQIRNRINIIRGYLLNTSNIDKYKEELSKLNNRLIEEDKKNDFFKKRIAQCNEELKQNFLDAEGRIQDGTEIKYTSIYDEYMENGINIRDVDIMTNSKIDEFMATAENNRKDMDEQLSAAELCYNNIPNLENKTILDSIKLDTIKARYYLTLIKILKLINDEETDCYGAIDNRKKILDLIAFRRICLEKMNVIFSIDPFSRIKLQDQIELINSFGANDRELSDIKREITSLSNKMEDIQNQNTIFLDEINHNKILQVTKEKEVLPNLLDKESFNDKISEVDVGEIDNKPTKIIKISDISPEFMSERVKEKTMGVINRVNELINTSSNNLESDITPEIVIEPFENNIVDGNEIFSDKPQTELFNEEPIQLEETPEITIEPFEDNTIDDNKEIFIDEPQTDLFVDEPQEDLFVTQAEPIVEKPEQESMFSQVATPFDEPALFEDRKDDDLFTDNSAATKEVPTVPAVDETTVVASQVDNTSTDSDIEMPEVFWDMEETEESEDIQDNVLSFEEGLAKLNLTENDATDAKTRKLVA